MNDVSFIEHKLSMSNFCFEILAQIFESLEQNYLYNVAFCKPSSLKKVGKGNHSLEVKIFIDIPPGDVFLDSESKFFH